MRSKLLEGGLAGNYTHFGGFHYNQLWLLAGVMCTVLE
jgi:hypothetical protein